MQEDTWKLFYANVRTRCQKLIEFGIWKGIDGNKFNSWLNNFETDQEKFFSSCILDTLIFKSKDQVIAMLYDLMTRDLYNLFRQKDKIVNKRNNPLILLQEKWSDPSFRIVAAVKNDDPPSKSGYLMSSHLVHHLDVCKKWTIHPQMINREIENGIKDFVLLDDIICTGEQICSTIAEWNLNEYNCINFYVAACVAHDVGIKKLKCDFPHISVVFAEKLCNSDSFFETLDISAFDFKNKNDAINFLKEFLKINNVKNNKTLGYGELGLVYGFEHNVPNASLPILYYENEKLNSLLSKR